MYLENELYMQFFYFIFKQNLLERN